MVQQPHFDDERTLSSARPVVPLEAIDAKVKHRRRWFLGGAFAVAMFLGAASAVISAYFKMRNLPDPEIQSLSVLSLSEETPVIPTVEVAPERPKVKPRKKDESEMAVAQAQPDFMIRPRLSEKQALRQIRDAVLVDQWEERRARRVERRERRREQHHRRGLSNIDEIFEGPQQP